MTFVTYLLYNFMVLFYQLRQTNTNEVNKMSVATLVLIVSGIVFVGMLIIIFMGGKSRDNRNTTTSYNGRSFEAARTSKINKWG